MAVETVSVLNWLADVGFFFTHEQRDRDRLAEEFRTEGIIEPIIHEPDECPACDAQRKIAAEAK